MKILVDAQQPEVLATMLTGLGYDAAHVRTVLPRDVDDATIWALASRSSRSVIVTRDADFSDFATGKDGEPRVIWLRIGNCSNERLLALMRDRIAEIIRDLDGGTQIVEIGW